MENSVNVVTIKRSDIYRDGGSYSFQFVSDDDKEYEFLVPVKYPLIDGRDREYEPPVIYSDTRNTGQIIVRMTWDEAIEYVRPLRFENVRFKQLLAVVRNYGKRPKFQ